MAQMEGKVVMVYNMGTEDHPLAEAITEVTTYIEMILTRIVISISYGWQYSHCFNFFRYSGSKYYNYSQVNDGYYHVVKFVRTGANATLQVDEYDVRTKNPKGENIISSFNNL